MAFSNAMVGMYVILMKKKRCVCNSYIWNSGIFKSIKQKEIDAIEAKYVIIINVVVVSETTFSIFQNPV